MRMGFVFSRTMANLVMMKTLMTMTVTMVMTVMTMTMLNW